MNSSSFLEVVDVCLLAFITSSIPETKEGYIIQYVVRQKVMIIHIVGFLWADTSIQRENSFTLMKKNWTARS